MCPKVPSWEVSEVRLVLRHWLGAWAVSHCSILCDSELVRTSVSSPLSVMSILEGSHKGVKQDKLEDIEFVWNSILCELSSPQVLVMTPLWELTVSAYMPLPPFYKVSQADGMPWIPRPSSSPFNLNVPIPLRLNTVAEETSGHPPKSPPSAAPAFSTTLSFPSHPRDSY